ncbi:MAG: diaminopimelate epimerase, partial [Boseongicola sp.]|nr:diaminopimelate epimerase [Boseongicola sp.]
MSRDSVQKGLPFMKMHGLGNDFVVIDRRNGGRTVSTALVRALGDRHRGVGFDQLVLIDQGNGNAAAGLTFLNADGSEAGACGNATRCVARYLLDETGGDGLALETERGLLACEAMPNGEIRVNMGEPFLGWEDVPLAEDVDTLNLPIEGNPVATGVGNPHCTFFVDDAESGELEAKGSESEHHPLFPARTNVQFASVTSENRLRVRVWERGVGVTLASGSSSCAVAVAAAR